MKGTFCHMKRVPGDRKRDEKEPRGENGAGGGREVGLGGQQGGRGGAKGTQKRQT